MKLSRSSSDLLKEKNELLESIIKSYLIDLTLCQPPTLFIRKNARGIYFKTNDKEVTDRYFKQKSVNQEVRILEIIWKQNRFTFNGSSFWRSPHITLDGLSNVMKISYFCKWTYYLFLSKISNWNERKTPLIYINLNILLHRKTMYFYKKWIITSNLKY